MTPHNRRVSSFIGMVHRVAHDISELGGDVAELRHQMEVGFTRVDARFGTMGKLVEKELRKQTQFFFRAGAVILAAIIGLYARAP